MAAPPLGPCAPFCTVDDVILCDESRYANLDTYVLDDMIDVATDLLWRMGGPYMKNITGICETTVRPCANRAAVVNSPQWERAGAAGYSTIAWGAAGGWYWPGGGWDASWGGCGCGGSGDLSMACGCSGLSQIRLGPTPIVEITEVIINGDVLDPACYRIDGYETLVRLPNVGSTAQRWWPCCSRVDLPLTEDNTFGVTFEFGTAPPPSGVEAAAVLAGELALARCGDSCDTLPEDVQRQAREGVDYIVISPDPTGLRLLPDACWRFLKAVNPDNLRQSPKCWSPDIGPPTRLVNT